MYTVIYVLRPPSELLNCGKYDEIFYRYCIKFRKEKLRRKNAVIEMYLFSDTAILVTKYVDE